MEDNNKEPFLLSPYQMYEIEKLTKQLEEIRDTIRARNNFYNRILYAFGNPYPIEETNEKVYHVSGFRPLRMCKILLGKGLKWMRGKGIYYNTTEYCIRHLTLFGVATGTKRPREHVSITHAKSFYDANTRFWKKRWIGPIWFKIPSFAYFRRFGLVPLIITYEIDTTSFGDSNVYIDTSFKGYIPTDDNGEEYSIFRYVQQECILSPFIKLKAITLALPIFGIYKVLWRRK